MFGLKRAKPEAFSDFLDQIDPSGLGSDSEAAETVSVASSPAKQSQDWLLQLLSGMTSSARSKNPEATPPIFASSYFDEETVYFEEAIAPLLEAIVSCEQDAIAEELGLHEDLSMNELKRRRRAFARDNHPDRLDPSKRDLATRRMTIANMLIDRELRQKSSAR
jgi:hypothetical protein